MSLVTAWFAYCRTLIRSRSEDQTGAANVEYALLMAFIAVVCIASITYFGLMLKDYLMDAGNRL